MSSDGPSRSARRDKRETCPRTGKVAYRTKKKAIRGAGRADVDRLRTYKCPHCGRWHLTSQVPPRRPET